MSSFVPKRQLLTSKGKSKNDIDVEKKKKDKHIDPIAIVPPREKNPEKPHVGWEFRYRVSKYMDALRDTIDEDQQQLKSDLQTMKQKRSKTIEKEKVQAGEQADKQKVPQQDADLDPELAQINEEGRKVGWAYRYRIRRKLDHLKLIQAETGVPFDLATLSGKREKKVNITKAKSIPKKKNQTVQEKPVENEKAVGWEYRYRVRRKLDALQQTPPSINQSGKRTKKNKKKSNEDTNDALITTFFHALVSTAKRSVCFLPLRNSFSFCPSESVVSKKSKRVKKLKTKKEHHAKQFIRGHHTKLGAEDKHTERRVDEQMRRLYKRPSYPPLQKPPPPPTEHTETIITVDSKKNQNKKKNQIIGQEVKIKPKHSSSPKKQTTSIPVTAQVPITTTPSVPLRTLSEFIKQEAATILKSDRKESQTPEEIQYEINETKEIIREQKSLKAPSIKQNTESTSSNDKQINHDTANLT